MFDAKKLSAEQVAAISQWAANGAQLADIQKRLEEELEIRLSYMDTRFLILDLGIEIRNLEREEAEVKQASTDEETENGDGDAAEEITGDDLEVVPAKQEGDNNVKVSVDELARPGLMASGRVTFGDGQGGMWYIDQMGRLGIDPDTEGYRPGEADIMAFQRELQAVMEAR